MGDDGEKAAAAKEGPSKTPTNHDDSNQSKMILVFKFPVWRCYSRFTKENQQPKLPRPSPKPYFATLGKKLFIPSTTDNFQELSFINGQILNWVGKDPIGPSLLEEMISHLGDTITKTDIGVKDLEALLESKYEWLKLHGLPTNLGIMHFPIDKKTLLDAVSNHCKVDPTTAAGFSIETLLFLQLSKHMAMSLQRAAVLYAVHKYKKDTEKLMHIAVIGKHGPKRVFTEAPSMRFVDAMDKTWLDLCSPTESHGASFAEAFEFMRTRLKDFPGFFYDEKRALIRKGLKKSGPDDFPSSIATLSYLLANGDEFDEHQICIFNSVRQFLIVEHDIVTTSEPIKASSSLSTVAKKKRTADFENWRDTCHANVKVLLAEVLRAYKPARKKITQLMNKTGETWDSGSLNKFFPSDEASQGPVQAK